ncbi:MAG: AI-2E family transporter [Acidobacteria bacterium]|nr:MAG: AI-2E family transporter [Acidobacteriota bacterium]REK02395.1 MAG: AI-2E family transporter [Acidobacteriota bacterium]REK13803.1 MAG: AI-2E family transporter [Acidobacteriota bacterium]REK41797.1 MAG: AI-2E family transporter [Acidobacteriota bacterium]
MTPVKVASICIVLAAVITLLIVAKSLLIPFVIAVLVWYLINGLAERLGEFRIVCYFLPKWGQLALSALIITFVLLIIGALIAENAREMTAAIPRYQENVGQLYQKTILPPLEMAANRFGLPKDELEARLSEYASGPDSGAFLGSVLTGVLSTLSGIAANGFLIVIYVIFLLFEQAFFPRKIHALFPDADRLSNFRDILERINESIQAYFTVKMTVSVMTGVASYLIMLAVGLDFAIFWAFLIFLLNFIPNIGSLVATAFPALVAILQFDTLGPFFVVLAGVGAIQLIVGNFVEPKMMGSSLNISSLVVIIALTVWGVIWGVAGMILCVPITVIMMIVLAQFPTTRPIAILLSEKGELMHDLREIHLSEHPEDADELQESAADESPA